MNNRIGKDTLMPIPSAPFDVNTAEQWYPPGHGDLFYSMWSCGVLDSLIQDGKEYAFISNVDNLNATVDLNIMYHLCCEEVEMCMEVITPTRADNDGGYLVGTNNGGMRLVELVEIPPESKDSFRAQHRLFNTNNIWINLKALKRFDKIYHVYEFFFLFL